MSIVLVWVPVETRAPDEMGHWAKRTPGGIWAPGEHGRRVGMSASLNVSAGRNVGWRRAHLWISPPSDGLLGSISPGCCGVAQTASLEL